MDSTRRAKEEDGTIMRGQNLTERCQCTSHPVQGPLLESEVIKTSDEVRNDCPLSTPLNCNLFKGGQINLHLSQWKELTANRNILSMVKGYQLKDVTTYPADLFPIFSQGSKKPKD